MSCAIMVALPCWPFDVSPLNELYRRKLERSITLIPFEIIFGRQVYQVNARMVALPCWPIDLSPLNELYRGHLIRSIALIPQEGTLIFFFMRRLGSSIYCSFPKSIRNIKHPKNYLKF